MHENTQKKRHKWDNLQCLETFIKVTLKIMKTPHTVDNVEVYNEDRVKTKGKKKSLTLVSIQSGKVYK